MATYEITLEFETVLSVDGTRVKSETSRETQIVTGVFADVAKVMFEHETNCIKHNRLPKLTKDVYTIVFAVAVYISTQNLSDNMQRWIL